MGLKYGYYALSSEFRVSKDQRQYLDKITDVGLKQQIGISFTDASYLKILRRRVIRQEVYEEKTWVSNRI